MAGFITATLKLPHEMQPITGTLSTSGGSALLQDRTLTWQGHVEVGEEITVSLMVTSPLGTRPMWLMATAVIEDGITEPILLDAVVYVTPHLIHHPLIYHD